MTDALAPAAAPAALRPRMSTWQQAALSLYRFATNAHWSAILISLLPLQARLIGGAEFQGSTPGTILLAGAFVSIVDYRLGLIYNLQSAICNLQSG